MIFTDYISHIGEVLEQTDLVPEKDADGKLCCRLELAKDVIMTITEIPEIDSIMKFCNLGPLPTENREELLRELLEANFMFSGTHGATLALDLSSNTVNLWRYENLASIHSSQIENSLALFASDALKYRDRLLAPAGNAQRGEADFNNNAFFAGKRV